MTNKTMKGALSSCSCAGSPHEYGLGGKIKSAAKKLKGGVKDIVNSKVAKVAAPGLYLTNKLVADGLSASGALGKPSGSSGNSGAIGALTPGQLEYFERPSLQFEWDRMQSDASRAGMGLGEFVANNWNNVAAGNYSAPLRTPITQQAPQPAPQWQRTSEYQQLPSQYQQQPGYARGGVPRGALASRYVEGPGSGRDDLVDAKVSDGEFVMDAETVSLLGDGSNKEGARRLEQMRQQLRKQKGGALSKGRFSPNAKAPLSYIKGKN